MYYRHILWDWNGTLLDDAETALHAINKLRASLRLPPTDLKSYREKMDTPIRRYYEKEFDLTRFSFESLSRGYMELYDREVLSAPLMSGAPEALEAFARAGCSQSLVSSFEEERLLRYIRRFGTERYFAAVSGDRGIHAQSKVSRAAEQLKKLGAAPQRTVLIGDTAHDAETAAALGADCILITCGHQPRPVLEKTGVPVVDSLHEAARRILAGKL